MSEARLRWLLRRGMKELDVVVTRYFERRYVAASPAEKASFERLLTEVEDPDIWAWVMQQVQPPLDYADVVRELRRHD